MAAFATNRYTEAKTSLELSAQYGTTQDQGLVFLQVVDQYITFWKEEKAIREKEAAADDLPRVVLHTTEGDIVLELFENEAPETVGNFINLLEKGFYDGRSFFRVTRGFLAQTGCPKDNGEG
ncbi:MAG TPA: peptidylprolyl isomerase, partial [Planctomycetaceae bacterium]|nr:peptidylprolyl isomerase [Planctomycetaceae bacterium]